MLNICKPAHHDGCQHILNVRAYLRCHATCSELTFTAERLFVTGQGSGNLSDVHCIELELPGGLTGACHSGPFLGAEISCNDLPNLRWEIGVVMTPAPAQGTRVKFLKALFRSH